MVQFSPKYIGYVPGVDIIHSGLKYEITISWVSGNKSYFSHQLYTMLKSVIQEITETKFQVLYILTYS